MPWMKWLPWRFIIRHVARAHGFLDPIVVLAGLHRLSQPSEVGEPIELLRAGVVFHARGLVNSRVIQHNLDWVWPYWVERQFDPESEAFIPRAFSITHVNLTHRNWTAVGWPDCPDLPIVDPRGLLTPHFDGWSLDCWVVTEDGRRLLPSRVPCVTQRLEMDTGPAVVTEAAQEGLLLRSQASVELDSGDPVCSLRVKASSDTAGWLVLALRPYNPEGISFVHSIALSSERSTWVIDSDSSVQLSATPDRHHVSDYRTGALSQQLDDVNDEDRGTCDAGMASAAALYALEPGRAREINARIPLAHGRHRHRRLDSTWEKALGQRCTLDVPDERLRFLYEAAIRTLVLHSPDDVYPGPYTYKRFWFRDAAFIIHGLLCAGLIERAERALDRFPDRQTKRGYFHSQEGEWDSNGEALWIMRRFCELAGRAPKPGWQRAVVKGARWIVRKRLSEDSDVAHAGLLPAGFSAEHLGPIDYYYWDDFWGIAGLQAGAWLCARAGDDGARDGLLREAEAFRSAVERSLAGLSARLGRAALPAAPYRRLDAGAIGSLAIGYPLQLCAPDDPRLLDTVEFLLESCFVDGGFFQDMTHSGINPYLTLHVAQVLLRHGDPRFLELLDTVAELASSTGQWPEAIHPRTGGGCMGDGQHVWAAAEWVLMMRNCFVREEGERLILGSGVTQRWLEQGTAVTLGPTPTAFGAVSVRIVMDGDASKPRARVSWSGDWHDTAPLIDVQLPGFAPAVIGDEQCSVELSLATDP